PGLCASTFCAIAATSDGDSDSTCCSLSCMVEGAPVIIEANCDCRAGEAADNSALTIPAFWAPLALVNNCETMLAKSGVWSERIAAEMPCARTLASADCASCWKCWPACSSDAVPAVYCESRLATLSSKLMSYLLTGAPGCWQRLGGREYSAVM